MPKLTYAQIKELQKSMGASGMDTQAFSRLAQESFASPELFSAGARGGLGGLVNRASAGIDEGLRRFGLSPAMAMYGSGIDRVLGTGQTVEHAFEGIPRMAVDLLPMLAGGVPGVAGTAATFASNTFEKTDSPGAAAVSALTTPLFPLAGKLGGAVATRLPGVNRAVTAPLSYMASTGATMPVSAGGQFISGLTRGLQFGGQQVGNVFGAATAGGLTSATAAEKGHKWDAFMQAFEPANLAATGISLFPFMVKDGVNLHTQGAEVKWLTDYEKTVQRYGEAVQPKEQVATGVAADVADAHLRQTAYQRFVQQGRDEMKLAQSILEQRNPSLLVRPADAVKHPDEIAFLAAIQKKQEELNFNIKDVYHGSPTRFKEFDPSTMGINTGAPSAKQGFFFASNKDVAQSYGASSWITRRTAAMTVDKANERLLEMLGKSIPEHGMFAPPTLKDNWKATDLPEVKRLLAAREEAENILEAESDGYVTSHELDPEGQLVHSSLKMDNPLIYDQKGLDERGDSYNELINQAKEKGHDGVIIKNTFDPGLSGELADELTDVYIVFDKGQIKINKIEYAKLAQWPYAGTLWTSLPLEGRRQLLAETEPAVRVNAAIAELSSPSVPAPMGPRPRTKWDVLREAEERFAQSRLKHQLQQEVVAKVERGLPLEDAVNETTSRVVRDAQESVDKAEVVATQKAARKVQEKTWLDEWQRTTTPELNAVLEGAMKSLSAADSTNVYLTSSLATRLRQWVGETKPENQTPESLQTALNQVLGRKSLKGVDTKGRTPIGETDGETYTVAGRGKGAIKTYTDRKEASRLRDQLASTHKDFAWKVVQTGKNSGKWQIVQFPWNETSGQARTRDKLNIVEEEQADAEAFVEAAEERAPLTQAEHDAHRPEEVEAVRVSTPHIQDYLETLPSEELAILGNGDAELGSKRAAKVFEVIDELKGNKKAGQKEVFEKLFASKLFSDKTNMAEFLGNFREHMVEFARQQGNAFGRKITDPNDRAQVGEVQSFAKLLRNVGLTEPEHVALAARLMALLDNSDLAFAELFKATPQGGPLGLFTETSTKARARILEQQIDQTKQQIDRLPGPYHYQELLEPLALRSGHDLNEIDMAIGFAMKEVGQQKPDLFGERTWKYGVDEKGIPNLKPTGDTLESHYGRIYNELKQSFPEELSAAIKQVNAFRDSPKGQLIEKLSLLQDEYGNVKYAPETQKTAGQRMVWLAAGQTPNRTMFTLAHELSHGLFALAKAGKLDPETTHKLMEYDAYMRSNTPEQNQLLLREVGKMLPESMWKDKGLLKLMNETITDPEEVLTNMNAIVSLALANAPTAKWNGFFQWMPKPLADLVQAMIKLGRKFFEALSGTAYLRKLEFGGPPLDPKVLKQLHGHIDNMYKIMRYDGKRYNEVREAIRLDTAFSTGKLPTAMTEGTLFAVGVPEASDMVVKYMWGRTPGNDKEHTSAIQKVAGAYDRMLSPLMNAGQLHPELLRVASTGTRREATTNILESEALMPFSMTWNGVKWVADKDSVVLKVAGDNVMASARDTLLRRAQVTEKTVLDNINEKDSETMEVLKRLQPEQQRLVRESILRQQEVNAKLNDIVLNQRYERLTFQVAETLMLENSAMELPQAQAQAEILVQQARDGTLVPVDAAGEFAALASGRYQSDYAYYTSNPQYISERRFGDYKVRVRSTNPAKQGVFDASTQAEQDALMAKYQGDPEVQGVERIKPTKTSFDLTRSAVDIMMEREAPINEALKRVLVAKGLTDTDAQRLVDSHSVLGELQRELNAKQLPNKITKRTFAGGREELDMFEQQLNYTRMLIHGLTKGTADAEFRMHMSSPKVRDHQYKSMFEQAWKQYREADPAAVRVIQKANYMTFLSFHLLNAMQDATQPLTGTLIPNLINGGDGIVSAGGRVLKAMTRLGAERLKSSALNAEEAAMLDRYRRGNRGLASYSDEVNNEAVQQINARALSEGKRPMTLGQLLGNPVNSVFLWSKFLHKKFTDFGQESAMLASYDFYRNVKKMTARDAEAAAFDTATLSMGSWGKAGRAVGVYSGSKTLGATVTALQTFAFNQISSWKNYAQRAIGEVPNITKSERANAMKAFGVHTASMFATAGLFGLPFVSAALALIDKMFGINSKEAIADFLQADDSEDYVMQQFALHGAFNSFGGIDYASRASTPGVLGMNPYEGWTLDSLAGPTWSVVKNVMGVAKGIGHGDLAGAGLSIAPNNIKRGLQAWRDDWEFRQKDGSLVETGDPMSMGVYTVLGLKPSTVARAQERDSWQRVDAQLEQDDRRVWLQETTKLLDDGDTLGVRAAIAKRVEERPGESSNAVARSVAEAYLDRHLPVDPRRSPGMSEKLYNATGPLQPTVSESERLAMSDQLLGQLGLGLPASRSRYRRAAEVDALRQSRPWLSYGEAVRLLEAQETGRHGVGGGNIGQSLGLGLPSIGL